MIFSRAKLGLYPSVNVIASLTVLLVGMCVLAGSLWLARREKQLSRELAAAMREH